MSELVGAVELTPIPARGLVPGGAALAREVKRQNTARARRVMNRLNRAAAKLQRSGWRTQTRTLSGEPLRDLLGAVEAERAHLLVVGARGTTGLRRLLLGSVAEGALSRCPTPVLVAR